MASISLGGVDLRDISSQTLYDKIAFVLQDPMLINASIQRNISLARQDASIEEIRKAAKIAQIDDLIMSLPKVMIAYWERIVLYREEKAKELASLVRF